MTQSNMLQQISLTFRGKGIFYEDENEETFAVCGSPPEGDRSSSRTNNVKSREKTVCGLWGAEDCVVVICIHIVDNRLIWI